MSTSSSSPPASPTVAAIANSASGSTSSPPSSSTVSTIGSVASPSSPCSRKTTTIDAPPSFAAAAFAERAHTCSYTLVTGRSSLMMWPATSSSIPLSSSISPPRSRSRQILFLTSRIKGPTSLLEYGFFTIEPRMNSSWLDTLFNVSLYSGSGCSGHTNPQICSKMKRRARPSSARPSACSSIALTHAAMNARLSSSEASWSAASSAIRRVPHSSVNEVFPITSPRTQSSAWSSVGSAPSVRLNRASAVGSSSAPCSSSTSVRSVQP